MEQSGSWLELSVAVDQEAAESVTELLARYGHGGGVVIEAAWKPTPESDGWVGAPGITTDAPPPAYTTDPTLPVTLRTYIPLNETTEETRQRIEQGLWHLGQLRPVGTLQVRVLAEEDWANAWKQHYQIQHIGQHTVIVPSWLDYTPQPGDVVLHLDPGMAFGTGLHPTTQLCLRLLEQHTRPGQRLLDVGCGSGILALAAAQMGASPIVAVDNDPVAVDVARENVQRQRDHGKACAVQVLLGSLGIEPCPPELAGPFDMVVANIIADVLIALAHHLAAALSPDGLLISSGIIHEREEEVALMLAAAGLHLRERHREGDWVALVHSRAAPTP